MSAIVWIGVGLAVAMLVVYLLAQARRAAERRFGK